MESELIPGSAVADEMRGTLTFYLLHLQTTTWKVNSEEGYRKEYYFINWNGTSAKCKKPKDWIPSLGFETQRNYLHI